MKAEKPGPVWGKKEIFPGWSRVLEPPPLPEGIPAQIWVFSMVFVFAKALGGPRNEGKIPQGVGVSFTCVGPAGVLFILFYIFVLIGRRECFFPSQGTGVGRCVWSRKSVINSEQTSPGSSQLPFPHSLLALGHLEKKIKKK